LGPGFYISVARRVVRSPAYGELRHSLQTSLHCVYLFLQGLFERGHMQYEADRPHDMAGEPHIADMTEKAIRILQKNTNGFFLLVESGRIGKEQRLYIAWCILQSVTRYRTPKG